MLFIPIVCLVIWLLLKPKKKNKTNYYIDEHLARDENDKLYEEYLKWAADKSSLPVEKLRSMDEAQADEAIEGLFKKIVLSSPL